MALVATPAVKAARLTQKALSGFQAAHDALVQAASLHVAERDRLIEEQAFFTEQANLAGAKADAQHHAGQHALEQAERIASFLT